MEPIKKKQMKDYIVNMLRNSIFSGSIQDGEELVQEVLAEKLGVSRMPVREALQQLELEGVLRRLPNRHMRVVGITPTAVEQNFKVLYSVESTIVSIIIHEQKDVQSAREAYCKYHAALPLQGMAECAIRELFFHHQLVCCLDNPFLTQMYEKFSTGYFAYVLQHKERNWKNTKNQLEQLINAIEEKNIRASQKILELYFKEAVQAAIGGSRID